jgi:glycosyltransferase involved in cell wall biosynthesis
VTKVVIQIPCYNEEGCLASTLAELPRELPGVDEVEWLIVNDGSTDATSLVARRCGVEHIVEVPLNHGLAAAFRTGLAASLAAGADIIVNTDADNQYRAADIPKLIAPILDGRAAMVVGSRPIGDIEHFSPAKKLLQRLGSWVVRVVSGTDVADAPSGFRAISREAALQLNVFGTYTYTLETIIQAGQKGMPVVSVPIRTNPDVRPSRLVRSSASYVFRSLVTLGRLFVTYRPMRFFFLAGCVPFGVGLAIGARWLALYWMGTPRAHVPSLVLTSILLLMGFQLWILGLFSELQCANRKLLEELQLFQRTRLHRKDDTPSRVRERARTA